MGPAGAIFMDKVCRIEAGGAPSTLDTGTHGQPGALERGAMTTTCHIMQNKEDYEKTWW